MPCEFCDRDGGAVLWRDPACRVVGVAEPGYRGYCRVIWHEHVREMTDLAERDRDRLMRVVFCVERALRDALHPEKINLASLGNLTPHLHWHVIPRFRDDPHYPNATWGPALRAATAAAHDARVAILLVERLDALGPRTG